MGKIEESSGIAIVCDNKILLCHSSNSKWFGSYMPPKGHIEKGEDAVEAALTPSAVNSVTPVWP